MNESVCNRNGLRAGGTFFVGLSLDITNRQTGLAKRWIQLRSFLRVRIEENEDLTQKVQSNTKRGIGSINVQTEIYGAKKLGYAQEPYWAKST